jgi:hypothetical protein
VETLLLLDLLVIFLLELLLLHLVGNVTGNVTGNLTGTVSGNATNVDGVVAINNGGTGATTELQQELLLV